MRKLFLSFLFCSICFYGFSQTGSKKSNAVIFNFGPSLRVTPVHYGPGNPTASYHPNNFNFDQNQSGLALNMGLQYYLSKPGVAIELGTSFRNDEYEYFEPHGLLSKHLLTADFHGMFYKTIPLGKNMLRAGIGYSSLDIGSDFTQIQMQVIAGDTSFVEITNNFQFSTFNFSCAYQLNQVSFELVNRFSLEENLTTRKHVFIPEIRILYNFKLKNEKLYQ